MWYIKGYLLGCLFIASLQVLLIFIRKKNIKCFQDRRSNIIYFIKITLLSWSSLILILIMVLKSRITLKSNFLKKI